MSEAIPVVFASDRQVRAQDRKFQPNLRAYLPRTLLFSADHQGPN